MPDSGFLGVLQVPEGFYLLPGKVIPRGTVL